MSPEEKRAETAAAYAEHVQDSPTPPKPPMGSQYQAPSNEDKAIANSHAADNSERAADFAHKFPGAVDALDARANFSRREMVDAAAQPGETRGQTMQRLKDEAQAAADALKTAGTVTVHGQETVSRGAIPGARIQYPCGCVATHPDPNATLPTDCPTHSIPPEENAAKPEEAA